MGKVKTYNEEKGFAVIARCLDATNLLGPKREFSRGSSFSLDNLSPSSTRSLRKVVLRGRFT